MRLAMFGLVCLVQLCVPAWMILRAESTLADGVLVRFRTEPIDPADMFRGRYVRLGFAELSGQPLDNEPFAHEEQVHASLASGADGFATVTGISHTPPDDSAYLTVRVRGVAEDGAVRFWMPMDRFYMEESLAPVAEREYLNARVAFREAWVDLRVLDGHGVIEQVYIDGVPLAQLARGAKKEGG